MSPTIGSTEDKSLPSFDFDVVDVPMGFRVKKIDVCIVKPKRNDSFAVFNSCTVHRGESGLLYICGYDVKNGEYRTFLNPLVVLCIKKPEYIRQ